MIRPGHHRPLGTVAVVRFSDWRGDPDEVRRSYEVVGVVETKTGYRLHLLRAPHGQVPASSDPKALWTFYKVPR